MAKNIYTVKPGESPADVAQKYTGRRDRYRDLLVLNKHLRQTTDGMTGRAVFDKKDWIPGMGIRIPKYWAEKGPMHAVSSLGYPDSGFTSEPIPEGGEEGTGTRFDSVSGGTCTPGGAEITEYKNYYYVVTQDDIGNFWKIPSKFNYPTMVGDMYSWKELRNANLDWVGGFKDDGHGACQLNGLYAGALLRVPKKWPEPKSNVKTVPITEAKDKCPAGQVFAGGKCVEQGGPEDPWTKKDGLDTVGADSGDSSTIWMLLAAGAAVAGGIFLYNSKKKAR